MVVPILCVTVAYAGIVFMCSDCFYISLACMKYMVQSASVWYTAKYVIITAGRKETHGGRYQLRITSPSVMHLVEI